MPSQSTRNNYECQFVKLNQPVTIQQKSACTVYTVNANIQTSPHVPLMRTTCTCNTGIAILSLLEALSDCLYNVFFFLFPIGMEGWKVTEGEKNTKMISLL